MLALRWLTTLCALFAALSSVGCAVSRYLYISLEGQPGVEIEAYDIPDLKHLYSSSRMPTAYSLQREDYRLVFTTSIESYLPEIHIAVEDNDNERLRISQQASRKARSDRVVPCGSFGSVDSGAMNELRFSWITCEDASIDEMYISFDVTSEAGDLVGKEDIPFELRANGFYVLPDLF